MGRHSISAVVLAILLLLPGTVLATYIGDTDLVPPPDGVYLSPAQVHATYTGAALTIILQDIRHFGFTNIFRTPSGSDTFETFDSIVDGNASVNGGPLFPVSLNGPVEVVLHNYQPGDHGTFDTEMLQLDLSGGGVRIRESPTQQSLGQTTITPLGGGQFQIDSFFDVFTELSLDDGQTFIPSDTSTHVDLAKIPQPSTWLLLGSSMAVAGLIRSRSRKAGLVVLGAMVRRVRRK